MDKVSSISQVSKFENKLSSIQALRGIAAILVVFCHSEQFISFFLPVRLERFVGYCFGSFGVDIFFVISGFIMVYICRNEFGQKGKIRPFILKRILRIFPMYWLTMAIVLAIILPSGMYSYSFPIEKQCLMQVTGNTDFYLRNLLIFPSFSSMGECPVIGVAWSLQFEMFFYYLFALLLIFRRSVCVPALTSIFVSLILTNYFFMRLHIENGLTHYLAFFGNDIILEFLFGCMIAELYLSNKLLTSNVAFLLIILSSLTIALSYHNNLSISSIRAIKWGIPSAFIVLGMLSLEINGSIKIPRLLIQLGDSSYSIYLVHLSIFIILLVGFLKTLANHLQIPGDLAVFIVWILCVFLGHLVFKYVERPITRMLTQYIYSAESRSLALASETKLV